MTPSQKASRSLDALILRMKTLGYSWGAPSWEVEDGDAQVLEKMRCPLCVGTLMYTPFVKVGSYRAFQVCSQCGKVDEF